MKYMLLIHQGDSPTPRSPDDWAKLSEDEQKAVYADYQGINKTPGVSPGLQLGDPDTATTVRVQDGKTLTTDGPFVEIKESIGGYFFFEADDLDAAIDVASRVPAASRGVHWRGDRAARTGLPRAAGSRARGADRLPRRLRSRRGSRSGGIRHR